jgi:hypothetical protein
LLVIEQTDVTEKIEGHRHSFKTMVTMLQQFVTKEVKTIYLYRRKDNIRDVEYAKIFG